MGAEVVVIDFGTGCNGPGCCETLRITTTNTTTNYDVQSKSYEAQLRKFAAMQRSFSYFVSLLLEHFVIADFHR